MGITLCQRSFQPGRGLAGRPGSHQRRSGLNLTSLPELCCCKATGAPRSASCTALKMVDNNWGNIATIHIVPYNTEGGWVTSFFFLENNITIKTLEDSSMVPQDRGDPPFLPSCVATFRRPCWDYLGSSAVCDL